RLLDRLVDVNVVQHQPRNNNGDGVVALEAFGAGDGADGFATEGVERLVAAILLHEPATEGIPQLRVVGVRNGDLAVVRRSDTVAGEGEEVDPNREDASIQGQSAQQQSPEAAPR